MKKFFLAVFFFTFFLHQNIFAQQIHFGTDKTISRAEVAKMLSFIYFDKDEIIELYKNRNINFTDSDASKWYDKYVNAVYNKKLMSGIENRFEPEKPLSLLQAQYILDRINSGDKTKIKITDENKNKNISYSLWTKLFFSAIQNLNCGIEQKKIIVLAAPSQSKTLPPNYIITSENYFSCDGIDFDFFDKSIEVLAKAHEIIALISFDNEFELKNCSLLKIHGNKAYVKCPHVKRFFDLQKKISPGVFDLKIRSGEIIGADQKNDIT